MPSAGFAGLPAELSLGLSPSYRPRSKGDQLSVALDELWIQRNVGPHIVQSTAALTLSESVTGLQLPLRHAWLSSPAPGRVGELLLGRRVAAFARLVLASTRTSVWRARAVALFWTPYALAYVSNVPIFEAPPSILWIVGAYRIPSCAALHLPKQRS